MYTILRQAKGPIFPAAKKVKFILREKEFFRSAAKMFS
jgi:hypothetical protein